MFIFPDFISDSTLFETFQHKSNSSLQQNYILSQLRWETTEIEEDLSENNHLHLEER